MDFAVEKMKDDDWGDVASIYRDGIAAGDATFETDIPKWDQWDKSHLRDCRLVARTGSKVVGWVALSPVSGRCVYSGVAEVSLYVKSSARRLGIGKALLQAVIKESEKAGIWTVQGGVFPENAASRALCKTCGFREVGRRESIGQMNGVWRDVILIERRSKVVGVKQ